MYPPGGTYSADGRWYWNGQAWVPAAPPLPNPGGMFWFFSSPDWIGPLLLNGLILFIPVAGSMVVNGWYLATRDNIRQGRWQAAPVGFQYLGRGARPWVVQLVYALVLVGIPILPLVGLLVAAGSNQNVLAPIFAALLIGLFFYAILLILAWIYFFAAVYDLADSHGIGFALTPTRLWAAATANSTQSWRAGGAYALGGIVVGLIGSVIPFASAILAPAAFLMACPAQAEFHGESRPS